MKKKATIIILDYFKAKQVKENVRSLLAQKTNFDFKIILIDNSCSVANAAILQELSGEKVEVIINKKNLGYIKAHNEAGEKIEGDYVLIFNPDIVCSSDDVLQKMIDYMDNHPEVGVLGPQQKIGGGRRELSVRAFPKLYVQVARRTFLRHLPILKEKVAYDEMQHLDYSKIQEVDWLQSSCVAVRRDFWENVGGFCEDYFLFMGDTELCFQAWKNGYKVIYFPEVTVYSDGKRASSGGFLEFFKSWVLRQHLKDSWRYRRKHFFDKNPRLEYNKKARKRV